MAIKRNRLAAYNPVAVRAISSACQFLAALLSANLLSPSAATSVGKLLKQLESLPSGIVRQELSVHAGVTDNHEMADHGRGGDAVYASLMSMSGALFFEIGGTFAADTYRQVLFQLHFTELTTRGPFADLISWEACFAKILATPGVKGYFEPPPPV